MSFGFRIVFACCVPWFVTSANGQTMYRCGSTFTQQPCADNAQAINAPGVPKPRKMEPIPIDSPASLEMLEAARKKCEIAILVQLKDPDSAKFSTPERGGFRRSADRRVLRDYLVAVNAKNSYGGYTGAKLWTCSLDADETRVLWSGPSR